jgi:hypothetical protein
LAVLGWSGLSDPALAWDDSGNVFLVGAAIKNPPKIDYIGIAVYKSIDGGQSWSAPHLIHTSSEDEKPWAAGDSRSISFRGRTYIVWDDAGDLRFARTLDHGNTWIGAGADPAGSVIARDSFSPEINVAADGDIYVVRSAAGREIKMIVSVDGGDSFHPVASPAIGITTLEASLPPLKPNGWPVLPGGTFRVFTLPSACVFGETVAVAWADYREGISRIYYALSANGGVSWSTGPSGQPLLTGALSANAQHFHPQIVSDPDGVIGCAFYEFGTDTRTGIQELWTDLVPALPQVDVPSGIYKQLAEILFGIIQDGSGVEIVGGHIRHIPPSGPPELDILLGVANHRIASLVASPHGIGLQKAAMDMVVRVAQQEIRRLEGKR